MTNHNDLDVAKYKCTRVTHTNYFVTVPTVTVNEIMVESAMISKTATSMSRRGRFIIDLESVEKYQGRSNDSLKFIMRNKMCLSQQFIVNSDWLLSAKK